MSSIQTQLDQMVWSLKYRPKTIAECILPDATKTKFQEFVNKGSIPTLLLTGRPGMGKTTIAKALCDELDYEVLFINSSNEGRVLDTLRTTVTNFVSTKSFEGKRKCVIFDEFDSVPDTVGFALKSYLEQFPNCSFIFTANFENKIPEAIHSRCAKITFEIPNDEKKPLMLQAAKRCFQILQQESVEFDKVAVVDVIKRHFPDMRSVMNELQASSATGTLDATTVATKSSNYDELVAIIKKVDWTAMRQWVGVQSNLDIIAIGRFLYNNAHDIFLVDSIPQLVLTTAEFQYKNAFVVDKEINAVAYLTMVMTQCDLKGKR
jgi:DNA polymerase III delta prime subunit